MCCFFFLISCCLNKRSPLLLCALSVHFGLYITFCSVATMKRRVNAHVVAVLKEIFLFFLLRFFFLSLFMQDTKCNTTKCVTCLSCDQRAHLLVIVEKNIRKGHVCHSNQCHTISLFGCIHFILLFFFFHFLHLNV